MLSRVSKNRGEIQDDPDEKKLKDLVCMKIEGWISFSFSKKREAERERDAMWMERFLEAVGGRKEISGDD